MRLNKLVQEANIRFSGTFFIMDELKQSQKLPTQLKSMPHLIDEIGKKVLEKLKNIEEYKLDDWIGDVTAACYS